MRCEFELGEGVLVTLKPESVDEEHNAIMAWSWIRLEKDDFINKLEKEHVAKLY